MATQRAKLAVRGISLYTRVEGQGAPIVFMHGGPGVDHSTLLSLRPLSATNTLVFYDHRCNGRSSWPEIATMTWDNLTADADALRGALGFETWAVCGHSFGGMVALEYAFRYPRRLSHLILVDSGADIWWVQHNAPEVLAQRGYSRTAVESARRLLTGQLKPWEVIPCVLRFGKAYSYSFNLLHALQLLTVRGNPQATVFGFGTLLRDWNVMGRLLVLSMPTLLMAGSHDFEFPPEHQSKMAALIPNAQLAMIDQAGHMAPTEHPQQLIRLMRDFLRCGKIAIH